MKNQFRTAENYNRFVYAFNKTEDEDFAFEKENEKIEKHVLDGRVSRMIIFSLIGAAIIAFRLIVF